MRDAVVDAAVDAVFKAQVTRQSPRVAEASCVCHLLAISLPKLTESRVQLTDDGSLQELLDSGSIAGRSDS
jgi:hypothetical protein